MLDFKSLQAPQLMLICTAFGIPTSEQVKHSWNPPETKQSMLSFWSCVWQHLRRYLQRSHSVTKDAKFQQLFHVLGHLNSDHNLRTRFLADTQACHLTKREKIAKQSSVCPPLKAALPRKNVDVHLTSNNYRIFHPQVQLLAGEKILGVFCCSSTNP